MDKLTIEINKVKFKGYHGYYKEEQLIGSFFLVSLKVDYFAAKGGEFTLENTVDYQRLHAIVALEMKKTKQLLEQVAQGIVQEVEKQIKGICGVYVSIEKCNPPIVQFNGDSVKVSLERNYAAD